MAVAVQLALLSPWAVAFPFAKMRSAEEVPMRLTCAKPGADGSIATRKMLAFALVITPFVTVDAPVPSAEAESSRSMWPFPAVTASNVESFKTTAARAQFEVSMAAAIRAVLEHDFRRTLTDSER